MNPNLKWKALFILAVILFCLYFLFGYPTFPTCLAQVKENFSKQIKLGLDLQGGTPLILEVQLQKAVAQETDTTADRISTALRNKNVHYDEVRRADDTHILVRNIDPSQYSVLSDIVGTQYSNVWDMAPAAGETNSYTLTLRPGAIAAIQEQTVTQSLETIAQRINALGLTEPTIQLHGRKDNEILVQLPGVGDPPEAARRFGPFTQQNIGRNMAIVLDHKVNSAPVINGRIDDSGMIEGNFSQESAHELALVLRAGALPASIKYLEERTVGPPLGADSIRHGVQASVLSLIVVMLFMLVYYRLSGGNAVLALILNLVILLAVLALFGAVLTLPGIAGVILTIGMGVDSNVLVFERVREEIRNGKSAPAAVDAGFDKAFLTIIDTHVTTVVSAFFLFLFGTGPIRGFAITLTIGLIANVFTAIYVSKAIFHYHLAKMDRQAELSI